VVHDLSAVTALGHRFRGFVHHFRVSLGQGRQGRSRGLDLAGVAGQDLQDVGSMQRLRDPWCRGAWWHMGRLRWKAACADDAIHIDGPRALAGAFPTWNQRSPFAGVQA